LWLFQSSLRSPGFILEEAYKKLVGNAQSYGPRHNNELTPRPGIVQGHYFEPESLLTALASSLGTMAIASFAATIG